MRILRIIGRREFRYIARQGLKKLLFTVSPSLYVNAAIPTLLIIATYVAIR